MMKNNFMICGLTGWCMEIIFTSLDSIRNNNFKLTGHTSIWMFPIYGMAAIIPPVYKHIRKLPALLRGSIYSAGIFVCEYLTGTFLKKKGICPWDYSNAKTNINGVIRLDYAPLWMMAGLLFERVTTVPGENLKSPFLHKTASHGTSLLSPCDA